MTRVHSNRRRSDRPEAVRPRALVVDDDDGYRLYVSVLLKRAGFSVDAAVDGDDALAVLHSREPYDLLLVDCEMPRMNGLQLIRTIRDDATTASVFAIMLTGRADVETKIAALTAGYDDFLVKATTEIELVAKIAASKRVVLRQQNVDATVRRLRGMAATDELTGLHNRRFLFQEGEVLLSAGGEVTVALFDLDDFKQINDTFGHRMGDAVLRDVAAVFERDTRYEDFTVRYGGDEFVMLMQNIPLKHVNEVVERVSSRIHALRWPVENGEVRVGVTVGLSTTELLASRTLEALLDAADRDLYKSKYLKKKPQGTGSYGYGRTEDAAVIDFAPGRRATDKDELEGQSR